MNDMRRAIEQKQREIEMMANKMTLPIDTDIMRMKIQKDIEARHRVEVDSKQQEIDRLSEHFYEVKR
jgi:ribosomal protein L23